ncbi:MAG: hypothetical protein IKL85_05640 [Lentisphaeria bacterium]|nr:hypothetical protein [Lentisphaeria bacterium]
MNIRRSRILTALGMALLAGTLAAPQEAASQSATEASSTSANWVHEIADIWRAKGADIAFLPCEMMDISSTQIRARLESGQPLGGLVPEQVEAYIRQNGLYGTHGDIAR